MVKYSENNTVIVQSKEINKPVYVRYLHRKAEPDPEVSLINAEGIPAASFMTDNLEPEHRKLDISREAMADWTQEEYKLKVKV